MTTLKDAFEALMSTPTEAKRFQKVYRHGDFKDETLFHEYVVYVDEHAKEWLDSTVPNYNSEETMNKQINLFATLLDPAHFPVFANLIEPNIRDELVNKLNSELKLLIEKGRFTSKNKRSSSAIQTAQSIESEYNDEQADHDGMMADGDNNIVNISKPDTDTELQKELRAVTKELNELHLEIQVRDALRKRNRDLLVMLLDSALKDTTIHDFVLAYMEQNL